MLKRLRTQLRRLANPRKAKILRRFFKTGKGQYGEGDIFLGITVPQQRALVKKYWREVSLADLDKLIKSKIHEERLIALLILVEKFTSPPQEWGGRGFPKNRKAILGAPRGVRGEVETSEIQNLKSEIYKFYIAHIKFVNNWDLVDLSAPKIMGAYLFSLSLDGRGEGVRVKNNILIKLAHSKNLWERRIAILATFDFIYQGQFDDTLKIAKLLLKDKHDLIHKAVGWMLREVGKRCGEKTLLDFLNVHYQKMPRTMLRYAIERLHETLRLFYLRKAETNASTIG
jgi:3-methyladenine DNA glycosylase AlkD